MWGISILVDSRPASVLYGRCKDLSFKFVLGHCVSQIKDEENEESKLS